MAIAFLVLGVASILVSTGCASAPSAPGAADAGPDAGPDSGPTWSAAVDVDTAAGSGFDLTATVDNLGNPAVAYFRHDPNAPGCNDGGGCSQWALVVARELNPGQWTTETVPASADGGDLTGHVGLALAFDTMGNPAVAYQGGESQDVEPGSDQRWHDLLTGAPLPSDLVVARKSGAAWTQTTLARLSKDLFSDAAITGSMVDDSGGVVGAWAGLAFDSDGTTLHVVQRDLHFGVDMSGYDASNLEYGHFNGANKLLGEMIGSRIYPAVEPSYGCIDLTGAHTQCKGYVHGSGDYTHLVLAGGVPALSFSLGTNSATDSQGAWFAMRTGTSNVAGADNWTRTQISGAAGRPGHGPSLAYDPVQGFAVGIFADGAGAQDLLVATSPDGLIWSTPNTVEALGQVGLHPAATWGGAAHAQLGLLYAYCNDGLPNHSTCDAAELRFQVPDATGPLGTWTNGIEHVAGVVPDTTALVSDGNGRFVAIWRDPAGGLKAARRTP